MKERWLWGGILLVILSWIGNTYYYQSKQIEHPIFLTHYYEKFDDQDENVSLYYLSNRKNPDLVHSIKIGDAIIYPVSQEQSKSVQNYKYQTIYSFTFDPKEIYDQTKKKGPISFSKVTYTTANGKTYTAPIGKITLQTNNSRDHILESMVSSSTNDNYVSMSSDLFRVRQPMTLSEINLPYTELKKWVIVKVNTNQKELREELRIAQSDSDFEDEPKQSYELLNETKKSSLIFKKKDLLSVAIGFKPHTPAYCNFTAKIQGTSKGKPFVSETFVNSQPFLKEHDVAHIISMNGGYIK